MYMMSIDLVAPFPYWGNKRRVAADVWKRLGKVDTYLELFFGSGSVLLRSPYGPAKREIVNDIDGLLANAWRGIKYDWEQVAYHCDYPISHLDSIARKLYLDRWRTDLTEKIKADPHYFDAEKAGWWIYVVSMAIGLNDELIEIQRCLNTIPKMSRQGINKLQFSDVKMKTFPLSGERLFEWFNLLSERLREVVIVCKDWTDFCSPTVTGLSPGIMGNQSDYICGIFLDPPYSTKERRKLYLEDSRQIAMEVQEWSVKNGDNPNYRICVAGYLEDYQEWPDDWDCLVWSDTQNRMGASGGVSYSRSEALWFSPHCVKDAENLTLFD